MTLILKEKNLKNSIVKPKFKSVIFVKWNVKWSCVLKYEEFKKLEVSQYGVKTKMSDSIHNLLTEIKDLPVCNICGNTIDKENLYIYDSNVYHARCVEWT